MSEQNDLESVLGGSVKEPKSGKKEAKIEISMSDLAAMMAQAVENAAVRSAQVVAEAMQKAREPYIDPKQKENDEEFRRATLEQEKRIRENLRLSQQTCPHKQGCNPLSQVQSQLSSFVLHELDTGLVIGICTYCQKLIRSDRVEDHRFFREKSANRMSRAGRRQFMDPNRAIEKGSPMGYDDETLPIAAATVAS